MFPEEKKAYENLITIWGKEVADNILKITHWEVFDSFDYLEGDENCTFDNFLKHCTACGGNWGGMLLTGIKELWPKVWDAIPDDMGSFAWAGIINTLILCGVEMPKDNDEEETD